jgi:hypothetical protein
LSPAGLRLERGRRVIALAGDGIENGREEAEIEKQDIVDKRRVLQDQGFCRSAPRDIGCGQAGPETTGVIRAVQFWQGVEPVPSSRNFPRGSLTHSPVAWAEESTNVLFYVFFPIENQAAALSFRSGNWDIAGYRITAGTRGRFAMSVAFGPLVLALAPAMALSSLLWPRLIVAASPASPPASFATEKEAEQHCSGDLAVWLDLLSRTYYYRGQQRYGATKGGAYVCRNEAKGAGMRAAPGTQ